MASLDFPSNPTNGQTYALNGVTYYYNSSMGAWLTQLTGMNIASSSNTQVLFNDAGIANGSSGLVFDKVANTVTANSLVVTGNVGVGTTTSLSPFTVLGPTSTVSNSASTRNPIASIRGGNNNNRFDFYVDNSGATSIMGLSAYNILGGTTAMSFYTGGSASEAMRIDGSGNMMVGTTATTGSKTNSTYATMGIFSTHNGTTSTSSAVAATIFTNPAILAVYMLGVSITGADSSNGYTCAGIIKTHSSGVTYTSLSAAVSASVSVSGSNIQYTQSSGVSQTATWSITRIL